MNIQLTDEELELIKDALFGIVAKTDGRCPEEWLLERLMNIEKVVKYD